MRIKVNSDVFIHDRIVLLTKEILEHRNCIALNNLAISKWTPSNIIISNINDQIEYIIKIGDIYPDESDYKLTIVDWYLYDDTKELIDMGSSILERLSI